MNAFVHHPLVILLIAVKAFSYMMTCEIKILVGSSGALFVLLGAMFLMFSLIVQSMHKR